MCRCVLIAVGLVSFCLVDFNALNGNTVTPAGSRAATAIGGGCYDCKSSSLACTTTSCTPNGNGTWLKTTGTFANTMNCFSVATGAAGTTTCTSSIPQTCLNYQTCTDMMCNNCGAMSPYMQDTKCTLGTYLCKGQ